MTWTEDTELASGPASRRQRRIPIGAAATEPGAIRHTRDDEGVGQREEAARAVVASHLGLPVTVHDDGSEPGMYDLRIELGDDRFAAVEVTAAERKDLAATQGAISKKPVLSCPQLQHGWLIVLAEGRC